MHLMVNNLLLYMNPNGDLVSFYNLQCRHLDCTRKFKYDASIKLGYNLRQLFYCRQRSPYRTIKLFVAPSYLLMLPVQTDFQSITGSVPDSNWTLIMKYALVL
jgi:hypothetical protein